MTGLLRDDFMLGYAYITHVSHSAGSYNSIVDTQEQPLGIFVVRDQKQAPSQSALYILKLKILYK